MKKFFRNALIALTVAAGLFTTAEVDAAENFTESEIKSGLEKLGGTIFPIGEPNDAYAKYFTGKSYLAWLSSDVPMGNVTFVNGAHTFWHIHHKSCQILIAESGRGYYQIWGEDAHELLPGQVVTIPEGVKHWHGAAPNCMFQHISVMQPVEGVTTEWLEPVDDKFFRSLK